jgi:hypothetical protein
MSANILNKQSLTADKGWSRRNATQYKLHGVCLIPLPGLNGGTCRCLDVFVKWLPDRRVRANRIGIPVIEFVYFIKSWFPQ